MMEMPAARNSAAALGAILLFSILLSGCANPGPPIGQWFGPSQPARERPSGPSSLADGTARLIQTDHYNIYTTITDSMTLSKISQVMEGSFQAYQYLAQGVPATKTRMDCYIFAKRTQWSEFTAMHTGDQASIYLQINRGGYTIGDWYVAYFIGDTSTLSVAAHEGWHQFCYRHFKDAPAAIPRRRPGHHVRGREVPRWPAEIQSVNQPDTSH